MVTCASRIAGPVHTQLTSAPPPPSLGVAAVAPCSLSPGSPRRRELARPRLRMRWWPT